MRIGISNLAWERVHDAEIAAILSGFGVDAIDVAPGRYFDDLARASAADISEVRRTWDDVGIQIYGMQALLFGTEGLNLFGSDTVQAHMLRHLEYVCRMAGILGASRLTFGSPKNRDATGWSPDAAQLHAVNFFDRLADVAAQYAVQVCLEPNPPSYQCNFMTTTDEAAAVVRAVRRPEIRLQLDTGALAANGEDAEAVILAHRDIVGHVHASEPGLVPLGSGNVDHPRYGALIRSSLPAHVVTIEMLPGADRPATVSRAVEVAFNAYGAAHGA